MFDIVYDYLQKKTLKQLKVRNLFDNICIYFYANLKYYYHLYMGTYYIVPTIEYIREMYS